jgi:H+/gluconate symporter-like permease
MVTGFPLIIIFVASIAVLLAAILVFKLNPFLAC